MPGVVQQALTSALLGGVDNLDVVANLASESDAFKARFNSSLSNANLSNAALIAGGVALTVAAITGAYFLIENRNEKVEDQRDGFIESVEQNVVSFFVPHSKEKRENCVKYVAAFIDEIAKNPFLYKFSRLLSKTIDKGDKKGKQYSTFSIASLPFGANFFQPREDGDNVDEAVQFINYFLSGEYIAVLDKVREGIKHDLFNDMRMFLKAEMHIQELNATRLIVILLANIAINIIQGINPNNNLPLTTNQLHTLSGEFISLLLKLKVGINSSVKDYKDNLFAADRLALFVDRLTERIVFLQKAYSDKLINDLNLNDVVNSGYAVIQNTTRPIFRLLYEGSSGLNVSMFFSKLIDLKMEITASPELITRLIKKLNLRDDSVFLKLHINSTPTTVMDLLAIYSGHNQSVRASALSRFNRASDDNFRETLRYIDVNYIQFIEQKAKKPNVLGFGNTSAINPAREYLVCFVSLMIEAYNVTLLDKNADCLSSNEQALAFLKQSLSADAYYQFRYILGNDLPKTMQDYLRTQIQLLVSIRLLSFITTLTEINASYLMGANFKHFLEEKLNDLKKLQDDFLKAKESLISQGATTSQNQTINLILSEIDHDLPDQFTNLPDLCREFTASIDVAIKQINNPKFKTRLAHKEQELLAKMWQYDNFSANAELDPAIDSSLNFDIAEESAISDITIFENDDNKSFASTGSNEYYASFQIKVFNAICIASSALLVIGLVFLLCMTYGISSLTLIASLSANIQSALMITGFVSATAGGVGLATSYFVPKFFNKPNDFIPVKEVTEDIHPVYY